MAPGRRRRSPTGELAEAIERDFGSFDAFRKELAERGRDALRLRLGVARARRLEAARHEHPRRRPAAEAQPAGPAHHRRVGARLLRRLPNQRPDYLTAFLDHLVDWDFVAKNLSSSGARDAAVSGEDETTIPTPMHQTGAARSRESRRRSADAGAPAAGRSALAKQLAERARARRRRRRRARPRRSRRPRCGSVDTMKVTTDDGGDAGDRPLVGVPGPRADDVVAGLVGRHEQQQRDRRALVEPASSTIDMAASPREQRALDRPPGVGHRAGCGDFVSPVATTHRGDRRRRGRRARRRPAPRHAPSAIAARHARPRRPRLGRCRRRRHTRAVWAAAMAAAAAVDERGRRGARRRARPPPRRTRASRGGRGDRRCRRRRRSGAGSAGRATAARSAWPTAATRARVDRPWTRPCDAPPPGASAISRRRPRPAAAPRPRRRRRPASSSSHGSPLHQICAVLEHGR